MPIFAEKESQILGDILFEVVNETSITRGSPGSKLRALAQATSKKLGRMWSQFDLNFVQAYLDGAEGQYLNFLGAMLNTPRLGETVAASTAADRVVKFHVTSALNFGGINNGSSIIIPAGETIGTQVGGRGIYYRLPYTTILPSTESEVYVTVEAQFSGARANVGVNTLKHTSFTNYADAINGSLLVTNESDIIAGEDIESDTNYRYRIASATLSSEKANETACRLAALTVPGVADIVSLPYFSGIGTFDMIVRSISPITPIPLVLAVKESVMKVKAHGIVPYVRAPYETGIGLDATLILKSRSSAQEENAIVAAVKSNLTSYINNLGVGEEFILNEATEKIMSTTPQIKDIGKPNEPLDEVRVSVSSRIDDNPTTSVLLGNYEPEADEKIYTRNLNVVVSI